MDTLLIGLWSVRGIDMVPDRAASLIGGLPGEVVEFTADGRYVVWGDPSAPDRTASRYRCHDTDPPGLDVWIPGLESLVRRCVYQVDGAVAQVCIAGDSRGRPAAVRRDDSRIWGVVTLYRWAGLPPTKRRKRRQPLLRPGKLIPDGFLADDRAEGPSVEPGGVPEG